MSISGYMQKLGITTSLTGHQPGLNTFTRITYEDMSTTPEVLGQGHWAK